MTKQKLRIADPACRGCNGTGGWVCPACEGRGQVDEVDEESELVDCSECKGYGIIMCEWCGGAG